MEGNKKTATTKDKKFEWSGSGAQQILLFDIQAGVLGLDQPGPREAWDTIYSKIEEFKDVRYEHFRDRLRDHRAQHKKKASQSAHEEVLFHRDISIRGPPAARKPNGKLIFARHKANEQLKKDVKEGLHLIYDYHELRDLHIDLYKDFELDEFKSRVKQEAKTQKFNHWKHLQYIKKVAEMGLVELSEKDKKDLEDLGTAKKNKKNKNPK